MASITITLEEAKEHAVPLASADQQLAADIIKTWKSDPQIRAEFGDNLEAYQAYRKADAAGRVRIRGQTTSAKRGA